MSLGPCELKLYKSWFDVEGLRLLDERKLVELAIEKLKVTNHQESIKFHQNWLRQGVEQFALIYVNLFIPLGIRRNCLRSGSSRSLYLFIRRGIWHCSNYRAMPLLSTTNKILLNSFCQGQRHMQRNYWGSSVWISKHWVKYWSYILHSSNTWEKIGTKWNGISTIYKLQGSLWFS